jgi:hypothetical protein
MTGCSASSDRSDWSVLLIDAANVIGSRPTGWWRDRAGAARTFVEQVRTAASAGLLAAPVVVVLEGNSRSGVSVGEADGVTVVHAPRSGDEMLLNVVADTGSQVTLVSADRALRRQAQGLGAEVVGPRWLMDLLDKEAEAR